MQDIDGQKSSVAYASKKLTKSELNYSVIEKECLALIWAIRKLHVYLYGKDFILETDHQPLVYLCQSKMENGQLMRWALALQPYQCKIRALKGYKMYVQIILAGCKDTVRYCVRGLT